MKYQDHLYYHIYNRGAHREKIFFENQNYQYFESLMVKYSRQSHITISAYCLMPNHYHIVAKQQPSGSLPSFMKRTFSAYTQAINKRFGFSGTLWQGQAKIKEITSDAYCLQVIRYVHLNPLSAKLVKKIEEWDYSNYLEWIGKRDTKLMDIELRDSYFPTGEDYHNFIKDFVEAKDLQNITPYLFHE